MLRGLGSFMNGAAQGYSFVTDAQNDKADRDRRAKMDAIADRQLQRGNQRQDANDAYVAEDRAYQRGERARVAEDRDFIRGVYADGAARADEAMAADRGTRRRGLRGANLSTSPALFNLIDETEGAGRYDTLFGHSQNGGRFDGVDVSRMTLGELREFSAPNGEYGAWVRDELGRSGQRPRIATPMGRHQIVGTTMRNAARALNLSDDTVFDARTQDDIAVHLAHQRLSGASTMQAKMSALRAEWEGFKHIDDSRLRAAIRDFERIN